MPPLLLSNIKEFSFCSAVDEQFNCAPKSSFNFGDVSVGTNSATQVFAVRNNGTLNLNLTSLVTGADSSQFYIMNPQLSPLAPNATWNAQLQFRPTSLGAKSATFQVSDPAYSLTATAGLTGNGAPVPPTNFLAHWTGIDTFDMSWSYGSPDPDGFRVITDGSPLNPVFDGISGSARSFSTSFGNCYPPVPMAEPYLSLRAYTGLPRISSNAVGTVIVGRPGWEPMINPSFQWLAETSAQLRWEDPTMTNSRYEIIVMNGATRVSASTSTADGTTFDLTGLR